MLCVVSLLVFLLSLVGLSEGVTRTSTWTSTLSESESESDSISKTISESIPTGSESPTISLPTESYSKSLPTATTTQTSQTNTFTPTREFTDTETYEIHVDRLYQHFDNNETLSMVHSELHRELDSNYWVDPPYSLLVRHDVTQVKLGKRGVYSPSSISWWFRIPKTTVPVVTSKAIFHLSSDYYKSNGNTDPESEFKHLQITASPYDGILLESGVHSWTCGNPGFSYAVLPQSWHRLAVIFSYGTELNNTLAATVNITLDGAVVCNSVLWNHTQEVITVLHAQPGTETPDSWCHNMTRNSSCLSDELETLSCSVVPGVYDVKSEDLCLYCCRQQSIKESSPGCCQYDAQNDICQFSRRITLTHFSDASHNSTLFSASTCRVNTGELNIDRISVCTDISSDDCDPYYNFRPFDCDQYTTARGHPNQQGVRYTTDLGDNYQCELHPRCVWHYETQKCVEHPLSEVRGAWQDIYDSNIYYSTSSVLSQFAQPSGAWVEESRGITAGYDGLFVGNDTTTINIIRSPIFLIGWNTEIHVEIEIRAAQASWTTDTFEGPIPYNETSSSGRFAGIAIQWNDSYVSTQRVCSSNPCTISFSGSQVRKFLHQYVTIDIVDFNAITSGFFYIKSVHIIKPATSIPTPLSGWLKGRACGYADGVSWSGVTCNALGYVSALELPYYSLSGSLHDVGLTSLQNLTTIDLSSNMLNGTIDEYKLPLSISTLKLGDNYFQSADGGGFPWIVRLWNLKHLNLSYNSLSGIIPDHYLNEDRQYAMEHLDLSYNNAIGELPTGLVRHRTLKTFRVTGGMLTGSIPSPLGLPMIDFDVGDNMLVGVAPFKQYGWTEPISHVGLENNQLIGLIPDWIKHSSNRTLNGNNWCCPIPSWARAPPPYHYYSSGHVKSLAWKREEPHQWLVPNCTYVSSVHNDSYFGVCPTVVGSCDGSISCGHQQCRCQMTFDPHYVDKTIPTITGKADHRCPTYNGCGCDMRRLRCIFRPYAPRTWCNFTSDDSDGICIDEQHYFDETPHPGFNPYYG